MRTRVRWAAPSLMLQLTTAALAAAVVLTATGAPAAVRAPLALVGILFAPGASILSLLDARVRDRLGRILSGVLAVVLSLALIPPVGVTVAAIGQPVTAVNVGLGLVVVTLAAHAVSGLRGAGPDPGQEGARPARTRPALSWGGLAPVFGVAAFAVALVIGASWQHQVDTGPYTEWSYAGALARLSGPLSVAPGARVPVPLQVRTTSGADWSGRITLYVDERQQSVVTTRVPSGHVVTLELAAPAARGLHSARFSAVQSSGGDAIDLTLRLEVGAG
jgi:hypothetical protein